MHPISCSPENSFVLPAQNYVLMLSNVFAMDGPVAGTTIIAVTQMLPAWSKSILWLTKYLYMVDKRK